MRILLGLCLVLLLGACNRVITDAPLFTASDAPDAPRLREGLWVMLTDDDCRVDTRRPAHRWPGCASPMIVRGGELLGYKQEDGKPGEWERMPFVLAAGEPVVLQFESTEDDGVTYQYFGLEGERMEDGRYAAFRMWPVLCGPPPPPTPKGEATRYVTLQPLPGMTIREDNCTTTSAGSVFAAAAASKAWSEDFARARWVRATWP
jgi:hypothetical protein